MQTAEQHFPKGQWPESEAVATVTLAFDERQRRRIRLTDDGGRDFLLDLPKPVTMAGGDGLRLSEGGFLRIQAAPEPVLDMVCASAAEAARLAWHIGNRHCALQVLDSGWLRIRDDHVLADMLRGLGVRPVARMDAFEPEAGAYAGGSHGHDH